MPDFLAEEKNINLYFIGKRRSCCKSQIINRQKNWPTLSIVRQTVHLFVEEEVVLAFILLKVVFRAVEHLAGILVFGTLQVVFYRRHRKDEKNKLLTTNFVKALTVFLPF